MKAMILAAGRGARMRHLTKELPKPLLTVKGKPLIYHHLEALAVSGVSEVVINTWYLGQKIIDYIGDGTQFPLKISFSREENLLDTGGGIVAALPLLGEDPFLVLSADIFTDFPFKQLKLVGNALANIVMVDNPNYHVDGDFVLNGSSISLDGNNKLTYANIGIFDPKFFSNAPQGVFSLGQWLRKHIKDNKVTGLQYNGLWYNVGTPEELELVSNLL